MAQSRSSPASLVLISIPAVSTAAGIAVPRTGGSTRPDRFLLLKEASNATSALSPTFSALLGALTYVDTWMLNA